MIIGIPLINGIAYTHVNIVLIIAGVPIVELTKINYADPQDVTLNYGTGSAPTSRGFGPVKPTGSITISFKEVQRITDAAPGGKIQAIPAFPVGVNFITEAGDYVRHKLKEVVITGRNFGSQVNNSQIEEDLTLSIAEIDWKAA